jgi:predicted nuclease of predicted toxin-antitoxin system
MNTPRIRFLADEGCDFAVVRALREAGFEVVAVCEIMSRSSDRDVIKLSHAENRVLLTEDKDFGWLVFVSHADSAGVVLIRFPGNARSTLPDTMVWLAEKHASELQNGFVVIEPNQVRFSRNSRFKIDDPVQSS